MSEPKWLDAPDGDGWWWRARFDDVQAVWVKADGTRCYARPGQIVDGRHDILKWQRAEVPPPPLKFLLARLCRAEELLRMMDRYGCQDPKHIERIEAYFDGDDHE
jgi:hypothetical protein